MKVIEYIFSDCAGNGDEDFFSDCDEIFEESEAWREMQSTEFYSQEELNELLEAPYNGRFPDLSGKIVEAFNSSIKYAMRDWLGDIDTTLLHFVGETSMSPDELKSARQHLRLSQEKIGEKLGLTKNYIWMMEAGRAEIDRRTELSVRYLVEHKGSVNRIRIGDLIKGF
jgi:DNA-binding XRE family transcriptional regulator